MRHAFALFHAASRALLITGLLSFAATAGCRDAAAPATGAARIAVTTAGLDLDADGYMVTVDGEPRRPVAPVDAITIRDLPTGSHTVALGSVAENCAVSGDNPRAVTVTGGDPAAVAFTVGCAPVFGSLRVITTATGADLDPDGFALVVDSGPERPVAVSDTAVLSALPLGGHTVELHGIAANCTVDGTPRQNVTLVVGAPGDTARPTADVAFAVRCVALSGTVRVTTATTGADLDSDGYTVSVDGGPEQAVGVNDTIVNVLPATTHTIALGGMASNCGVSGDNPRTVTVMPGGTSEVVFAATCAPLHGWLRVTTTTTGADLDSDGYAVLVDEVCYWYGGDYKCDYAVPPEAVDVHGAVMIAGLPAGDHTVRLDELAANCAASGSNPRTVTVAGGDTTEVTFAVECSERDGWLRVTTSTSGADLDPDGYKVLVDFSCSPSEAPCTEGDRTVGVNETVTFWVGAGGHSVELRGLAASCTVSGANPRPVTVPPGDTTDVAFAVTCEATGSLNVTAVTTGLEIDPTGYAASVDGGPAYPLGVNGTVTIPALAAGGHNVSLGDVATNCRVLNGGNPRSVLVTAGETAGVTFEVTCTAAADMMAADYQWCSDNGFFSGCGSNIVVMLANGSDRYFVADGTEPAWSPDGTRIVYNAFDPVDNTPSGEVFVVNLDDRTAVNLTQHPAQDYSPAWSPNGSKIAFASDRDGQPELYVMNADGSGVTRITENVGFVGQPAWSPDATKIAFDCQVETGNRDLCAVNVASTGFTRLTSDPAADVGPAWSPDGTRIAFATARFGVQGEIAVMNADGGGGVTRVLAGTSGGDPTWSPDGGRIAFSRAGGRACDNSCAYSGFLGVMNADGTGLVWIGDGSHPAWRPRSQGQ